MELPLNLDGKVADPFYLIVSLGTLLALTPIPEAEIVSEIPAHAEQNHRSIKMPALEHAALRP
jgi:hypothetical protein